MKTSNTLEKKSEIIRKNSTIIVSYDLRAQQSAVTKALKDCTSSAASYALQGHPPPEERWKLAAEKIS